MKKKNVHIIRVAVIEQNEFENAIRAVLSA